MLPEKSDTASLRLFLSGYTLIIAQARLYGLVLVIVWVLCLVLFCGKTGFSGCRLVCFMDV